MVTSLRPTCFLPPSGWIVRNPELIRSIGSVLAEEALAQGISLLLGRV